MLDTVAAHSRIAFTARHEGITITASAPKSTESAQLPQHVDSENMPLPSLNRYHHHPCLHQRSLPTSPRPARKQCVQSATAQVSNPSHTIASTTAHILFDTGSYRTYVTAELANKLQLKPTAEETLSISTFGTTTSRR